MQTTLWQRLQMIDRRIIYVILLAVILLPLFVNKFALPIVPSQESIDFYNTVEAVAKKDPNKLIIVSGQWSAGTRGENQWQAQAIITHLMRDHLRFALISFDPQNVQLTQSIVDKLAPKYGYIYGRDYVNWGFKNVFLQTLKGLVIDIPGTIKADYKGTPLKNIPVMSGIHDIKDVGAIVEVTPSGTIGAWIGLVQGVNKTPLLYAPTAVMAPDSYPYLDSKQISGLLTGVKGAGDYEKLLGVREFGTRATGALSMVYALLILLVILGNLGYYRSRAAERKEGR